MITQVGLKELFNYCADTGVFTRLVSTNTKNKAGEIAGYVRPNGYRRINIDGKHYYAHRLAWLYVHGTWPAKFLDHINGYPSDNRIANLREATKAENMKNTLAHKTNTSGKKGVSWHKASGKWQVGCRIDGNAVYIGLFATSELASQAYENFAKVAHGEFYRTTA